MNKTYGRINWENYPSDETPLNESNLNKIDVATDEIDNRVITLDTTKATKEEVSTLVQDVTFEEKTGIITITKKNGSKITIDTQMEKIAVNFSYNAETQQIILTLIDGTKQYIDLAALITQYEFLDSDTVAFSIDSTGKVSAIVKEASIQEKHLQPNYLADIKVEVAKAQASQSAAAKSESNAKASETAAATSESNAAASADTAQNYAVADTDSAKYYYEQARRISESFSGALRPMGTVAFANLPALSEADGGSMYNISDQFTTTAEFKEGAGNTIPAGANVYKTEDGKWDVLAGTPVTGVKGSAESRYRRGNVDITAENVGAVPVGGNAGSATTVQDYNDTSKKIKVGWVGNSLSQDQILGVACYASGDNDTVKAKIKDVSKATFKNWLGEVSPSDGSGYYVKNEILTGNIDLDNITVSGIYHLAGTLVNNPESCNATLIVDFNVGTPYQLFIPDYNYRMYKRVKSNGNWSSWTSLFTWNNLEGKPVARKIDIGTASNFGSFSIDNQSSEGNTLKILNVMYLNEYCTFNGIDMKHYKIAVWANLPHIGSDGYCEFYIRKDSKIIKPRTSETELPSTTVNVSPFFDLQVMYGDNDKRNELEWFNEDDGRMLFTGTNGVYCFYIDCWAQ